MNKLTQICHVLSMKQATSLELAQTLGLPQKKIWSATSVLIDGGEIRALKTPVNHPMWRKGMRGYRYLRLYELTDRGRMRLTGEWKRPGPMPPSYGQGQANRKCAKCGTIYSYVPSAKTKAAFDCGKCQRDR